MRRIDRALQSVDNRHRQESYTGPLASTSAGGHNANVNNLYNSQVRNAKTFMPYGISSRPSGGVKAQTIVNDNSDSVVIGVYDPSRPPVGAGELCLYSSGGCTIYLSNSGTIEISKGEVQLQIGSDIKIKSGGASINVGSTGNITINTGKSVGIKSTGNVTVETSGKLDLKSGGETNVNCSSFKINGTNIDDKINSAIDSAISNMD